MSKPKPFFVLIFVFVFIFAFFIANCSLLIASVPQFLTYQGKLVTPDGVGINDTVDITFTIYDDSAGGANLWQEIQSDVPVSKGLFDVILGSVEPLDLPFDFLYWLDIIIDDDTLLPRVKMTSSSYAFRAKYADSAGVVLHTLQDAYNDGDVIVTANASNPVEITAGGEAANSGRALELRNDDDNTSDAALYASNAGAGPAIYSSGDLRMSGAAGTKIYSNADINVQLDEGGGIGTTNEFSILDDAETPVFTVDENGNVNVAGNLTVDGSYPESICNWADSTTFLMVNGRKGVFGYGNIGYGINDSTHVNLGVGSITGSSGVNRMYCTVGGGLNNESSGSYAFIGGGRNNLSKCDYTTVAGGDSNTADNMYSTIGGGHLNTVIGNSATIGGGEGNNVSDDHATISGGLGNTASRLYSTVCGGHSNNVSGYSSVVSGGGANTINGAYSGIAGGYANDISADYSFSFGYEAEVATDYTARFFSAAYPGSLLVGGDIKASGELVVDTILSPLDTLYLPDKVWMGELVTDSIEAKGAVVKLRDALYVQDSLYFDGSWHTSWPACNWVDSTTFLMVNGQRGVFGYGNVGHGTNDSTHVNLGVACTTGTSGQNYKYCTVSGGKTNSASGYQSAIGGGMLNTSSGGISTIAGGDQNEASGDYSIVGGGAGNTASGVLSFVGGGFNNTAGGNSSTVSGGDLNTASGDYATVPGGYAANATNYGQLAHASGKFNINGDAQTSVYVLRNQTIHSDFTTELFLDGSSQRIILNPDRTITFDILIVARSTDHTSAGYSIKGVIENDGGTTQLVGTPTIVELGEDNSVWYVSVTADNVNDALAVSVTGSISYEIRWVATVRTVEVMN